MALNSDADDEHGENNPLGSIFVVGSGSNMNDQNDDVSSEDSEYGSEGGLEGIVDRDYMMDDDDVLFEMFVDKDVKEASSCLNQREQFGNVHGEADCVGNDLEDFINDLDKFPKFNPGDMRKPKFEIGMEFSTREQLKHAIDTYNIKNGRAVKYLKNDSVRMRVICKDRKCKWFLNATRLSGETCMQIRKFNLEHTCLPVTENSTLTSTWMSKHYLHKFRNYPNLKAADFRKEMSFKLGLNISRSQAWRARSGALKEIYGDAEAQYNRIWDFCTEVMKTNPGTTCYVKTNLNDEGKPVFQRWYICWAACKEGYHKGCRRLIGVDGCHLKGRFGGQLLVAVAVDPNNNIFPLAYAVVEVENKSSWEWFLGHLVGDINVGENDDYQWTFMSDKQKGLIEAFNTVLPGVDHRFCVRHLHENFKRAGFKGLNLKIGLWTAATATTEQYFKLAMGEIKSLDESAYVWLADKPPEQWSRAYFTTKNKCEVLLNNMCEVFNSFILDARDKPILSLISMVKDLIMVRMQLNRENAAKWEEKICPKPRIILLEAVKEASSCLVLKSDKYHFEVDDSGKKIACKARKYLCSICKEEGHNVKSCKKRTCFPNVVPSEGVTSEGVQEVTHGVLTQESIAKPNQESVVRPSVRQNQGLPRGSPKSKVRRVVDRRTSLPFVPTQPGGVVIRAPPPMVENLLQNRCPFRPPGKTFDNQQVIREKGQKFVRL